MRVPFADLAACHLEHARSFHEALDELLASSAFIGGQAVADFEREFAAACGARHAVGCANGTDALHASLRALGIGAGMAVVTVANTFIATAEAISQTGAEVIFAEVGNDAGMDPASLAEVLERHPRRDRIKCVLPVHLYGQPADLPRIAALAAAHGLPVLADGAQAHGALIAGRPIAAQAALTTFSFFPGKNLGALGDAGAIVCDDERQAAFLRGFCNHGRSDTDRHQHLVVGMNSRLDALQAAFLRRKLAVLPEKTRRRQEFARLYDRQLAELPEVERPPLLADRLSVFHLYVIRLDDRETVAAELKKRGVETGYHYRTPLHLQPAYRFLGLQPGALPATERLAAHILSLPLYPEMTEEQVEHVVTSLKESLVRRGR